MAVVAEGPKGRVYLPPVHEHELIAATAFPDWKPETNLPDDPRNFWTLSYGLTKFSDLFTPRQLVVLNTFSDLIHEAIDKCEEDAILAGRTDDQRGIDADGTGAKAYAQAVGVYLGFALDKVTDRGSSLGRWDPSPTQSGIINTFSRQALPMTWDFAESNPLGDASGNFRVGRVGCKSISILPSQWSGLCVPYGCVDTIDQLDEGHIH